METDSKLESPETVDSEPELEPNSEPQKRKHGERQEAEPGKDERDRIAPLILLPILGVSLLLTVIIALTQSWSIMPFFTTVNWAGNMTVWVSNLTFLIRHRNLNYNTFLITWAVVTFFVVSFGWLLVFYLFTQGDSLNVGSLILISAGGLLMWVASLLSKIVLGQRATN